MRDQIPHSVLAFLILVLPGIFAEAEPVDIENVPTPMVLADLLPEGGIDAIDIDYWMILAMVNEDGNRVGNRSYYHWSVKPVDGRLVFTHRTGYGGANGFHQVRRSIYTAQGEFVSYKDVYRRNSGSLRVVTGKIEADKFVLETAHAPKGQNPKATGRREVSMALFEDALPVEFLPLIQAYHIRNGSLGYTYKTIDIATNNQVVEGRVEDLGVENAQLDGSKVKAHFLKDSRKYSGKRERHRQFRMLVLEDGTPMSMQTIEKLKQTYTRSTEAEVTEMFNLDQVELPEIE